MRIIKKYATRKMYDVKESKFITLTGVASIIATGEEVQVIDNRTGDDITHMVLAQIILLQQKQGQNLTNKPGLFHELIKKGTISVIDFLEKPVGGSLELISLTEEKIRKIIKKLTKMGQVSKNQKDYLLNTLLTRTKESKNILEAFIKKTIIHMNIPTRMELKRMRSEIIELKKQLSMVERNNKTTNS